MDAGANENGAAITELVLAYRVCRRATRSGRRALAIADLCPSHCDPRRYAEHPSTASAWRRGYPRRRSARAASYEHCRNLLLEAFPAPGLHGHHLSCWFQAAARDLRPGQVSQAPQRTKMARPEQALQDNRAVLGEFRLKVDALREELGSAPGRRGVCLPRLCLLRSCGSR